MTSSDQHSLEVRIRDIAAIAFGQDLGEITATMNMVLMLYEMDDHPEVIRACKTKLAEGVDRLRTLGQQDMAGQFRL